MFPQLPPLPPETEHLHNLQAVLEITYKIQIESVILIYIDSVITCMIQPDFCRNISKIKILKTTSSET